MEGVLSSPGSGVGARLSSLPVDVDNFDSALLTK